ncbi:hypothetical protein GCM10007423_39560 [Dyadobacter endophyticus]|uniref:Uncharacterized protein n=1 Tax=Dyadobacter endophyticus TaxID=1749036 RepID=A0ABQ1YXS7_9BACT|nr:hypothetical protein [Dyadobacter endophyticus]GGH42734.1 hypothetical protein GCM10007423_39560 [Dyadobacter endophyticus]
MSQLLTFEAALKKVAQKHGHKTFGNLIFWEKGDPYWKEAAELYARWMCNEAVKADRSFVIDQMVASETSRVIHKQVAGKLPLPFPDEI